MIEHLDLTEITGDLANAGYVGSTASYAILTSGGPEPAVSMGGIGGSRFLRGSTAGTLHIETPPFQNPFVEGYCRARVAFGEAASGLVYLGFVDSALTPTVGTIFVIAWQSTGLLTIYRDATLLATSVGTITTTQDVWTLLRIHGYLHDTAGFFKVYVGSDVDTPFVEATSADTLDSTSTKWDAVFLRGAQTPYWDDIAAYSITLLYDGGTGGAPAVGDTFTGAAGGTVICTAVDGDATSGRLVVRGWNATDFVNNEALTAPTNSFAALVHAPNADFASGFEPGSTMPQAAYVGYVAPAANGATSGLTGSDADSTDNYLLVDEVPHDGGTTYVEGDANAEKDTYALTDYDATVAVLGCHVVMHTISDVAGLDHVRGVMRAGAADYPHDTDPMAASVELKVFRYSHSPDLAVWDGTNLPEIGAEFLTAADTTQPPR